MSIADKEVFDFRMVNHVDATEGDAYTDMIIVDTSVTLTVGCIQVIFLNKFVSSILVSVHLIHYCIHHSSHTKKVNLKNNNNTDTDNYYLILLCTFYLFLKLYLAPITYAFKKRRGPRTEPWGLSYCVLKAQYVVFCH